MIISLVAYILGCLVIASMLYMEIDFTEKKEIVKNSLLVITISLLWPAFGVWVLWEVFYIWMMCHKNQIGKLRK